MILLRLSDWAVNNALRFREAVKEVEEAVYFLLAWIPIQGKGPNRFSAQNG